MNIRRIIIIAIILIISTSVFAQKDIVQLIIDGKKIGQVAISEKPAAFSIKKSKYKKISSLILIIKQSSVISVYKKTLQIADEKNNYLYQVSEDRTISGSYKIDIAKMRQQLLKQHIIKVFLAEDPANDMMKLPSRRKLLAELHLR